MGPLALLLGLFVLLGYLLCAGPTFYWLDSSEFVAAAWGLGVAHPPGHPLASLLSRLLCLLPVGTLAFRVTLASALAAAGATSAVALLTAEVLRAVRRVHPLPDWIVPLAASSASLCVGLSYTLGFQAVRAEVYALNVCLLATAVWLLVRWDRTGDRRHLFAAALVLGLSLCNHHLLVLLALPGILVFVLLRARRPRPAAGRAVLGVVLAGALGLCTLAYLPLRARQAPLVDWGAPTTVERLYWTLSAQAFHKSLDKAARETVSHRAGGAAFAVLGGLGPLAALAALGGLYLLLRLRGTRHLALLLSALVATNLISPLLVGFDPLNPDAHGYLVVAVAFLCPALAVFVAVVSGMTAGLRQGRALPAAVCLAAFGFPAYQGVAHLPECDLRGHWAAEETARQTLALAPGSLLITSYFETVFNAWALQATGDVRPEVELVHRGFLGQPGYAEDLARRMPELAALVHAWRHAGRPPLRLLDLAAQQRPVAVEYDLSLEPELAARLGPGGLMLPYGGRTEPADLERHVRRVRHWTRAVGPVTEGETRRALAWTHYQLLQFACRRGLAELARFHDAEVHALAPRDARLAPLEATCGLKP